LDFQHLQPEENNATLSDDLAAHHGHPDSGAGQDQPVHNTIRNRQVVGNSLPLYPFSTYPG